MCFSATASFASAAILAALGISAIKIAGRHSPLRYFAASPIIFALQQFCEGAIWISATNQPLDALISIIAAHIFLIIAFLVWPIWIPLVAWYPETDRLRKNLLLLPLTSGILFGIHTVTRMYQQGVWAKITDHHILYPSYGSTEHVSLTSLLYCIAVITPLFISSKRYAWLLGTAIAGSLGFTLMWYSNHVTSVWCFFSAVLSSLVIYIVSMNRPKKK
ncbi:MAG TPA: DUF6629 family protein [Candidatus Babeliales bacterium]|nr:DUF6629 family protein [Candidatus Babeliales bacterium]